MRCLCCLCCLCCLYAHLYTRSILQLYVLMFYASVFIFLPVFRLDLRSFLYVFVLANARSVEAFEKAQALQKAETLAQLGTTSVNKLTARQGRHITPAEEQKEDIRLKPIPGVQTVANSKPETHQAQKIEPAEGLMVC